MLTEYQNQIFNVEENGENVCLWKYTYVKDFDEKETRRGIKYYEKTLDKSAISTVFSVVFYGTISDRKYVVSMLKGKDVDVICDDAEYAKKQGLLEIERGVWLERKNIDDFDKLFMVKTNEDSGDKELIYLEKSEFQVTWSKYVTEVNI